MNLGKVTFFCGIGLDLAFETGNSPKWEITKLSLLESKLSIEITCTC